MDGDLVPVATVCDGGIACADRDDRQEVVGDDGGVGGD
jgi:hypothetical protein